MSCKNYTMKRKDTHNLKNSQTKLNLKKEHPFTDDETRKEFEQLESLGTEARFRSLVYGMIFDFEENRR